VSSSQQRPTSPQGARAGSKRGDSSLKRDARPFLAAHFAQRPPLFRALSRDALAFALHRGEAAKVRTKFGRALYALRLPFAASEFFALALYRLRVVFRAWHIPIFPSLINWICAIGWDFRVGNSVTIDEGVYLPHGQVDIEGLTYIGNGCYLAPFVGIGLVQGNIRGPRLEGNVFVGTGVKILGPCTIGHGATLGANAAVLIDVPAGATAVGVPARIILRTNPATSQGSAEAVLADNEEG